MVTIYILFIQLTSSSRNWIVEHSLHNAVQKRLQTNQTTEQGSQQAGEYHQVAAHRKNNTLSA